MAEQEAFQGTYFEAVGRRKSSVARVRIFPDDSTNTFLINGKTPQEYFGIHALIITANAPLRKLKKLESFSVSVKTNGGGTTGQAEAIRLGISRALVKYDQETRLRLKKAGFLKRDPRAKERKKYGLRGARRAPQWSKR
ncbi:MAG: 30S ribosomal protein S9 [Candidatus Spechtbacteria bacterium SB0662_bin_43]|uniref:Small ribosomal subunit protein uS9 n=1 Tax=Candidatus Spechtbacteria bacterium SB0662_bin_43 TaxID=2604897 RepID=A0A845DAD1_9BACT|nr:30S ribosomal protein S9 [Candidatus Spechtbacteria bacterium SB0662_bin_43]